MLTRLESPGITPLHSLDQNVDTKAIVKALPQDPEIKKRASAQLQLALSGKVSDKLIRKTVLLPCL